MMLDSDILAEAWDGIRRDFPFFSGRYKVVILREMGYALKKAREDERQRIRERIEEWADDYAVDWGGIELVRVDFLLEKLEEDSE